jgi:hypothetical protein
MSYNSDVEVFTLEAVGVTTVNFIRYFKDCGKARETQVVFPHGHWLWDCISHQKSSSLLFSRRRCVTSAVTENGDNNRDALDMGQKLTTWVTQDVLTKTWHSTVNALCPCIRILLKGQFLYLIWNDLNVSFTLVWLSLNSYGFGL